MSLSNYGIAKVRAAIIVTIIVAATAVAYYVLTLSSPSPPPSPTATPTDSPSTPKPTTTPNGPTNVENVGGKYNVTLRLGERYGGIEYTDEVGKHSGFFLVNLRSGLDWIKVNTPENATFLCWWDHGHMIKGYAERNTVVRNPSTEILESVAGEVTEFEPHERIFDVATAFATTDLTVMMQIIEKYEVTHILVSHDTFLIAYWIFIAAEFEWKDYLESQGSSFEFTDYGKQTMIARLLENRDSSFHLIYEDQEIKVYETYTAS